MCVYIYIYVYIYMYIHSIYIYIYIYIHIHMLSCWYQQISISASKPTVGEAQTGWVFDAHPQSMVSALILYYIIVYHIITYYVILYYVIACSTFCQQQP